MSDINNTNLSKRQLLKMIGYTAGASVMYQAMGGLGFAGTTGSSVIRPNLTGAPKGSSVIVLGAGIAGLVAAYELKKAGYTVKILEFQDRAGGRAHSVYGGDKYTDTDGVTQACHFDGGLFFNVAAWRIPYHHQNILSYCKELGIKLDPFIQLNFNAYLHTQKGFNGEPKRYREILSDFNGQISELLSKAINADQLDSAVTKEDQAILLEALRSFGGLDQEYRYRKSDTTSRRRGFDKALGGGLKGAPKFSTPLSLSDLLNTRSWQSMSYHFQHQFQQTMFEPRGGMEMIGHAFAKQLEGIIQYQADIVDIHQTDNEVTIGYKDLAEDGQMKTETADWCVCTLPLPILRRIHITVDAPLKSAINAVPYESVVKIAAQYKRRFWEQDEGIYGGMSLTDLPNTHVAYPSVVDEYFSDGKGILMNAYIAKGNGSKFTAMSPDERVQQSLNYVEQIHPQARKEFDNGYSTAWDKVPWTRGGFALWNDETRKNYYKTLCRFDGRIVLAGEHASYLSGWLEGSVTSALDAISRLHKKAVKTQQST